MKVWVYVEGKSDSKALSALWRNWAEVLRESGWGIRTIPLDNKSRFFSKIGSRAVEKLMNNEDDLVVGLPDLHPNQIYENTEYQHRNLQELINLQRRLVERSLQSRTRTVDIQSCLNRFYPCALKYDLEVLLLTVPNQLKSLLRMRTRPQGWRLPPENQNHQNPPKKIIERLFRTHLNRRYRETTDCYSILNRVDLSDVLFDVRGVEQCPCFKAMVDWVVEKTGAQAY